MRNVIACILSSIKFFRVTIQVVVNQKSKMKFNLIIKVSNNIIYKFGLKDELVHVLNDYVDIRL